MATEYRACDVDLILDGDATPKSVRFCRVCRQWICDSCRSDSRRVDAAIEHGKRAVKKAALSVAEFFGRRQARA